MRKWNHRRLSTHFLLLSTFSPLPSCFGSLAFSRTQFQKREDACGLLCVRPSVLCAHTPPRMCQLFPGLGRGDSHLTAEGLGGRGLRRAVECRIPAPQVPWAPVRCTCCSETSGYPCNVGCSVREAGVWWLKA